MKVTHQFLFFVVDFFLFFRKGDAFFVPAETGVPIPPERILELPRPNIPVEKRAPGRRISKSRIRISNQGSPGQVIIPKLRTPVPRPSIFIPTEKDGGKISPNPKWEKRKKFQSKPGAVDKTWTPPVATPAPEAGSTPTKEKNAEDDDDVVVVDDCVDDSLPKKKRDVEEESSDIESNASEIVSRLTTSKLVPRTNEDGKGSG